MDITEKVESREFSGGITTLIYMVGDTDDDVAVLAFLLANTPTTYEGGIRERHVSIRPERLDTSNHTGVWLCTVRYLPPDRPEDKQSDIGSIRITGTSQGGTQHITTSIKTVAAYAIAGKVAAITDNGGHATKGGGLINATENGVVGVDIISRIQDFTVTKIFDPGSLPNLNTLWKLTATTNDDTFTVTDTESGLTYAFAAKEVLFNGYTHGSARTDGGVEFSYSFSASENRTDLEVGSMGPIVKKGWNYLWSRYQKKDVGGLKIPGQEPVAAYTERLYEQKDFDGLEL